MELLGGIDRVENIIGLITFELFDNTLPSSLTTAN